MTAGFGRAHGVAPALSQDLPVATARWVPHAKTGSGAAARMLCLPFAGGGASAFVPLRQQAPDWLDVLPVQFPGREARIGEDPIASMPLLIARLVEALAPLLDRPYALLGYSLGARVAYCLTQTLEHMGLPLPESVLVAAHRAPDLPRRGPALHQLPSAAFWDRLATYEGTPAAIIANHEFRALFEKPLRADFALAEGELPPFGRALPCPITAFAGRRDALAKPDEMAGWAQATRARFEMIEIDGGHFFLREAQDTFRDAIVARLVHLAPDARRAA